MVCSEQVGKRLIQCSFQFLCSVESLLVSFKRVAFCKARQDAKNVGLILFWHKSKLTSLSIMWMGPTPEWSYPSRTLLNRCFIERTSNRRNNTVELNLFNHQKSSVYPITDLRNDDLLDWQGDHMHQSRYFSFI